MGIGKWDRSLEKIGCMIRVISHEMLIISPMQVV